VQFYYIRIVPIIIMKLIIVVLSSLLIFVWMNVSAQSQPPIKTVLSVTPPNTLTQLPILPLGSQLKEEPIPNLPLLRIPQSYYKQYLVRVMQLDHRSLQQNLFIDTYVFSVKSKDHDGYDYYLPVSFAKKEWGEAFVEQLPKKLRDKAVVVKLQADNIKCNCFSKF